MNLSIGCITHNKCIICKHKMRNFKRGSIKDVGSKFWFKKKPNYRSREHPTENFNDYHEKKGQERVPLAKSLRITEDTMQATIDQDGKAGHRNTSKYPLSTKLKTPQKVGKELPIDMVLSLFQVYLYITPEIPDLNLVVWNKHTLDSI